MPNAKHIVGIDLGGTNMQIGVVDANGNVVGRSRKKTQADQGQDKVIERLVDGIETACQEAKIDSHDLWGVGVGAPGAVDHISGVVLEAVNLRWNDVPLAEILTQRVGVPTILDNDVNVAVFGEWKMGAGKGVSELLGVWMGTGIGGGLILNNQLYQGSFLTAGEIGHTTLFPGVPIGSRSFEQNCSRTAVADRLVRLIRSNRHSSLAPAVHEEGGGQVKSKMIAQAYEEGDELTREVVDEVAHFIGIVVANAVTLLSLPRVVLGGGLTEAVGKPLVSAVRKSVREHVFPERCRDVEIVASALEDDAGIVGAALLARQRLA
jgi:glucokinase